MKLLRFLANPLVIAISGFATILCLVGFNLWGQRYGVTTSDILVFELARTPQGIYDLFEDRSAGFQTWFLWMLLADFAFIDVYVAFGVGALAAAQGINTRRLSRREVWICTLPFFAGLFDYLENTMGLIILKGWPNISAYAPLVGSIAATAKFTLLGLTILLIPVFWLRRRTYG